MNMDFVEHNLTHIGIEYSITTFGKGADSIQAFQLQEKVFIENGKNKPRTSFFTAYSSNVLLLFHLLYIHFICCIWMR